MATYQTFNTAAQAAVSLLEKYGVWNRTPGSKGAVDSVQIALAQGWSGQQCLACVEAWLAYANTHAGRWVKCPGMQAAARLRDLQLPTQAERNDDNPRRYITGKYAAHILHDQQFSYTYLFDPHAFPCPGCHQPTHFDKITEQSYCANPECSLFMRTLHPWEYRHGIVRDQPTHYRTSRARFYRHLKQAAELISPHCTGIEATMYLMALIILKAANDNQKGQNNEHATRT